MSWLSDELVSASSGNFSVTNDLSVTGNAAVTGDMAVTGDVTVGDDLVVNSNGALITFTNCAAFTVGNQSSTSTIMTVNSSSTTPVVVKGAATYCYTSLYQGTNLRLVNGVNSAALITGGTTGTACVSASGVGLELGSNSISRMHLTADGPINTNADFNVGGNATTAGILTVNSSANSHAVTLRGPSDYMYTTYHLSTGDALGTIGLNGVALVGAGVAANAFCITSAGANPIVLGSGSGRVTMDVNGLIGVSGNMSVTGNINHTGSVYGFVHDAGLWEDLRFPAQGINPAGSTAPPDVSNITGLLMFGPSTNEIISGVAQMPHGWKSGTNVHPHVHIMADAATNPRAAATATAADGVAVSGTNYFTSATGGFTGHANEWLAITVTGTNTQAIVGSYQIQTVVSDTNVLLTSNPTNGADDDSVTWAIYPDTVALKFEHAAFDVGETWDQSTYTNSIIYHQLDAHDGNAVHEIAATFSDIDMSGKQDSSIIAWRFTRLGDSAGDTYADDLHVLEVDFHYRHSTLGSINEYGEDA